MGLIVDTGVFITYERLGIAPDFSRVGPVDANWISAVTYSELLAGVHMANSEDRRVRRLAFVEKVLVAIPVLSFTRSTAPIHAEIGAFLRRAGKTIGPHDLMIAATALEHGHSVLTLNFGEFERVPGLTVVRWTK